jgi:arylsulfatase A-like enzyme
VTQVPLVVRLPDALGPAAKASRGRVVKGTATLLDVMPTLLDVAGVRYPKGAEPSRVGRSLLPELVPAAGQRLSDHVPSTRPILGEVTIHPMKLRSLREGRWWFLRAESPLENARALYDDVSDPGHRRNRIEAQTAEAMNLEAVMNEFFRRLGAVALTRQEREIDPETAAQLKRLGYTGGR